MNRSEAVLTSRRTSWPMIESGRESHIRAAT